MAKGVADVFETEFVRSAIRGLLEDLIEALSPFGEIHAAVMDARGDLIDAAGPNALHFPSFEACAKAAKKYIALKFGETVITNDPYSGNTRLCDLFLLQGVFGKQQANELRYQVAVQLTVPALLNKNISKIFTSVEDEGFRIPPTLLDNGAGINREILQYLSQSGVSPERLGSALDAVKRALKNSAGALIALEQKTGREKMQGALEDLERHSETLMRRALHEIPDGDYSAHDVVDNDGIDNNPLRVQCHLNVHGENVLLGFTGTAKQVRGPFNCNYSVTLGACFWVFRSLLKTPVPVNKGAFRAFSVEAPDGTLVNAKYPAALLGGYYETSKRIVDVLYLVLNKALPSLVPCQNGGSSNVSFMKFGADLFVDTLGCGGGGAKDLPGADAVHATLHNDSNPSIEEIERAFPIQITHNSVRESSGGDGRFFGGNGLTRGYKFLAAAQIMLLADRRISKARGLFGGVSGLGGEYILVKNNEKKKVQGEKRVAELAPGESLLMSTPGGGGWGKKEDSE